MACTRTLFCAIEHNFKKDSLIETHKFDRDKHTALKTLKDLSISCQGVVSSNMHYREGNLDLGDQEEFNSSETQGLLWNICTCGCNS
jgi:hypothetical protein